MGICDYLNYINQGGKTWVLWVASFPREDVGLYIGRKGTEQQHALVVLFPNWGKCPQLFQMFAAFVT